MNKGYTMLKTLTLSILALSVAFAADPPGQEPPKKSDAELLYEKLLEANLRDLGRAYEAYQKALEVANQKIIKGLEDAIKDLNNPRKGNLSIADRARAIEELTKKIEEVKKGAVGEVVVCRGDPAGDLMGEGKVAKDPKTAIVGSWTFTKKFSGVVIFNSDGSGTWGNNNRVITWKYLGRGEKNSLQYTLMFDDDKSVTTFFKYDFTIGTSLWEASKK